MDGSRPSRGADRYDLQDPLSLDGPFRFRFYGFRGGLQDAAPATCKLHERTKEIPQCALVIRGQSPVQAQSHPPLQSMGPMRHGSVTLILTVALRVQGGSHSHS